MASGSMTSDKPIDIVHNQPSIDNSLNMLFAEGTAGRQLTSLHLNPFTDGPIPQPTKKALPGPNRRRLPKQKYTLNTEDYSPYAPIAIIKDHITRTQFVQIARGFVQFETYLAEFFQAFGNFFQPSDVELRLQEASDTIAKRRKGAVSSIDPGAFGNFCAAAFRSWSSPSSTKTHLTYRPVFSDDYEYLKYIQDGHEILYWWIVIDMFNELRQDNVVLGDTHAAMMLHVITSTFALVTIKRHEIHSRSRITSAITNLRPMVKGIDRRVDVLSGILRANLPDPANVDLLLALTTPLEAGSRKDEHTTGETYSTERGSRVDAWYWIFGLYVSSIILACIPTSIGFAKNWTEQDIGSSGDADFFYLIQGNIVSTFGNVSTLLLLERSNLARPKISVWIAVVMATACNVVSIGIYCSLMSGWSALIGFIGQVVSASSVVISTYNAVTQWQNRQKEKLD